jgi:uncharacterized protein YjbJ (UPF0337 family)
MMSGAGRGVIWTMVCPRVRRDLAEALNLPSTTKRLDARNQSKKRPDRVHRWVSRRHLNSKYLSMVEGIQEHVMDENRKEGLKNEIKGGAKEVAGKVTGNKAKEVAGNVQKNVGKVQNEVGKAADRARDDAKKSR